MDTEFDDGRGAPNQSIKVNHLVEIMSPKVGFETQCVVHLNTVDIINMEQQNE